MNWFKQNKKKIILGTVITAVLVFAFWYGGDAPGLKGWNVNEQHSQQIDDEKNDDNKTTSESEEKTDKNDSSDDLETSNAENVSKDSEEATKKTAEEAKRKAEEEAKRKVEEEAKRKAEEASKAADEAKKKADQAKTDEEKKQAEEALKKAEAEKKAAEEAAKKAEEEKKTAEKDEAAKKAEEEASKKTDEPKQEIDPKTGKDKYQTDPVPEGKPIPVEPQDQEKTKQTLYCTFSISCKTILSNMEYLDPEKVQCVPDDGWILAPQKVAFTEGENVYDVLSKVCKNKGIQMEASFTPMYNSVYIEGINNLYEFDCGQLSGWMYKVNGWFPNYGASRYVLKNGDVCCWVYTCDLGNDVGGGYAMGN